MQEEFSQSEKILCITNDFGPRAGGIETFVIGLIERLPRNSVIVYTSSQADSSAFDEAWLKDFGVEVIRDKSKVLLPSFRVARAVRALVSERAVTRVFFGAAAPLALLAQGLRKSGVQKIVALTHGHEVWWAKLWPFSLAIKRIGAGVDALTYLGDFTRSEISQALSEDAKQKMVRIAPGIDTSHFRPRSESMALRKSLGLHDKRVIISVGRLVHRKGQDVLIQALPEIISVVKDAHLVFVGEGPYRKQLEKLVLKFGLFDRVTFIGRVNHVELPQYIGIGDLFAMPSRSRLAGLEVEGLGIVYLEASACGLPVIGGSSGGAPDALVHGETGLCVNGRSSHQVAQAAITILTDKELSAAMGKRGREWIVDQWQWSTWAEKFQALLK